MSLAGAPQTWKPPGTTGLASTFIPTAHATPVDAAGDHAHAQPSVGFAVQPSFVTTTAQTPAPFAHPPQHQQPLSAMAAAQGNILQSLLMQQVSGLAASQAGSLPTVWQVPNNVAPAPTLEQQAFLLQLLAAQQQVLAVQAGQLDAVSGMAAMAQGALGQRQSLNQSRSSGETGSVPKAAPHFSSDAATEAPRALNRQASANALQQALTGGGDGDGAPQGRLELVFPRRGRKCGELDRKVQDPVLITYEVMQRLFHLPLTEAARQLGLSPTAIKGACRRLGIKKWPFRMVTAKSHRRAPRKPSPPKEPAAQSGLSLLSAAAEVELNASSTELSTTELSTPSTSPKPEV
uniref:RWP-RK domain-containing protein n=1 Tax=Hemiselmis tepida TaxID=464990 RepID=A0A7S0VRA5_9CRYP|mmetsp:Transcript_2373/g.5986  ORF Transcript_2373/g.5986 Transcript_2373/m.5986 type:complete len:348 (+) Transcript_2373:60-1103(+)